MGKRHPVKRHPHAIRHAVISKTGRRKAAAVAAASLVTLGAASVATSNLSTPPMTSPSISHANGAPVTFPATNPCPLDGDGGDPALNEQKNRYVVPTSADIAKTIKFASDIVALPQPANLGKQNRTNWSAADAAMIGGYEAMATQVEGKLVRITSENKANGESVNCHRWQQLYDYHIFIADQPGVGIDQAVVVEMTPRWRSTHPTWTVNAIQALIDQKATVRVTGWLMFDEEHTDVVGKYRAAVWELHPVTQVQYKTSSGAWNTL